MATLEIFNITTLIWQLPASPVIGLILLAHGCRQSPRVWFERSLTCAACSPWPEERCMAEHAVQAGFAVVAASNGEGTLGCWQSSDVAPVRSALDAWRRRNSLTTVPLFLMGPSSGGYFSTQAARHWADVAALSVQVSVPSLGDVASPLPSGAPSFPPLELVLLRRDTAKLSEAAALSNGSWQGKEALQPLVVSPPLPVSPNFFSERIKGLSPSASEAVRAALVATGRIDASDGMVRQHPSRGQWKEEVERAVRAQPRSSLPQGSHLVAMDGIFAALALAWGNHASTCRSIGGTLAFFGRYGHQRGSGEVQGVITPGGARPKKVRVHPPRHVDTEIRAGQ